MSTDNDEYLDRVKHAFEEDLACNRLRLVSHEYFPEKCGNSTVVLHAREYALKLTRNRGEEFAQVAHPDAPDKWSLLQLAIRAVAERTDPMEYSPGVGLLEAEAAALLYSEHRDTLATGYGSRWQIVREALEHLEKELETAADHWHASPEGKKWLAEMLALGREARKNASPEFLELLRQIEEQASRK